ncbi:hypothetical protein B5807_04674 [Epicoccum nigrum]|uniref:Helicase ATP-binding domain-containing protein n=1 Tax=Epicoccum nigrum TaxID=105696 RepID=A0A1Y2M4D2_EPING|nr:hypothetical protein B5807_04674 [Epicoccum nigrum]
MTYFVHHGKSRLDLSNSKNPPDVVLTTYETIEYEGRRALSSPCTILAHYWKRIILDEAHIIRNHSASTAKAIARLKAWARWAISGTPVQNKLTDFLGLFIFLHFVPYNNPKVFDDEVSQLWRDNSVEDATKTFKKLLSSVMIRWTKAILDLPARTDTVLRIPFDAEEEEYYRCAEQPVIQSLDEFFGGSLPNAIQQINKLRLICNLGLYVPRGSELSQATTMGGSLQETLATRVSLDTTPDASFFDNDPKISSKVRALIQQIQAYPAEKQ